MPVDMRTRHKESIRLDGGLVTAMRLQRVLSVGGLAQRAGCTPMTIWNLTHGRAVSLRTAGRIAAVLGVEVRELLQSGTGSDGGGAGGPERVVGIG
jgi:transcriptional regulator with XRE-family HTH domain